MPPDASTPMTSTLQAPCEYREEIRKSRFVAHAAPATDAAAALDFIARVAVPDATHNCWAYRIGGQYRFNDDGEPGGTAGRPILQAIEGQQCDQVVVVVTRWFGGVKLGTGGLARAYGGCAAKCLRAAPRVPIVLTQRVGMACAHAQWPIVQARLKTFDAQVDDTAFDAHGVRAILRVPRDHVTALRDVMDDISRGQATFDLLD